MEWVETTGKTVDEAKERALDQLGVDVQDTEFQILDEPKPGLFGRMRGEARVRARVRPMTPRAKAERPRRDKTKPGKTASDTSDASTEGPQPEARPARAERPARPPRAPRPTDGSDERETYPIVEDGPKAEEFLVGLANSFGIAATASTHDGNEGDIEVRLDGEGLGFLIGPRGDTLLAVQDLTRASVQRHGRHGQGRLHIDIGGYRQRRNAALVRFTHDLAQQVIASGDMRVLEAMSAPDRKVVHGAAQDIDGVTTRSQGEDPHRCVVIEPAR